MIMAIVMILFMISDVHDIWYTDIIALEVWYYRYYKTYANNNDIMFLWYHRRFSPLDIVVNVTIFWYHIWYHVVQGSSWVPAWVPGPRQSLAWWWSPSPCRIWDCQPETVMVAGGGKQPGPCQLLEGSSGWGGEVVHARQAGGRRCWCACDRGGVGWWYESSWQEGGWTWRDALSLSWGFREIHARDRDREDPEEVGGRGLSAGQRVIIPVMHARDRGVVRVLRACEREKVGGCALVRKLNLNDAKFSPSLRQHLQVMGVSNGSNGSNM